jgi:nucleoside-triphosphatase THEP1
MLSRTHPGAFVPDLLAEISSAHSGRLYLLTGDRQAGKTSLCADLATRASAQGYQVAGLLSPAVFRSGKKIGIDLLDLATRDRRRLARLQAEYSPEVGGRRWRLDQRALSWGNQILGAIDDCDVLILDELGPLEMLERDGLTQAFELLEAGRYSLACVVVRPALLPAAFELWPQADSFAVTRGTR